MKVQTENAVTRRAIAPDKMPPEEALELLQALKRAPATPAAVALDYLMSGDDAEDGAQTPGP